MNSYKILVPGGEAKVFEVKAGEFIKVIDVEGKQVADLIGINLENKGEYLSTAHTRMMNGKIFVQKGDILYSNGREPIMEIVQDTVGIHDTLYPCCDPMRYKLGFGVEGHRNCRENFHEALKGLGFDYWRIPDPVNLFQNTPINADGTFSDVLEPKSKPGDFVVLKSLKDLVVGISACPMDLTPLCGYRITDISVEIGSASLL